MTNYLSFHEGELEIQKRANTLEQAQRFSFSGKELIPEAALEFIAEQSLVVVGSIDSTGKPWCSVVVGTPGFIRATDRRTLVLNYASNATTNADPLFENSKENHNIGMLFIEFQTRRRLRVNGKINSIGHNQYVIEVDIAYANCPKYIQRRELKLKSANTIEPTARFGQQLEPAHIRIIKTADTAFVASAHPSHGVDASHRGGNPGFITVIDEKTLQIPDYPGNNFFNTLGNFLVNSQAGLSFIDFEQSLVLQLSGRVEIFWLNDNERYWQLSIERWREIYLAHRIQWTLQDRSPFNPQINSSYA